MPRDLRRGREEGGLVGEGRDGAGERTGKREVGAGWPG